MKIDYVKDTFPEYLGKKDHLSASEIKNFIKSPKYYYWNKYQKSEKDDGRHFAIGSAIHEMIMEPHLFNKNYIVIPKVDRRTKEGKISYETFLNEAKEKTILQEDEMEMIVKMAKNALENKTFISI